MQKMDCDEQDRDNVAEDEDDADNDNDDVTGEDSDDNWDDWLDESVQSVKCLLCDLVRQSPESVLHHCYDDHGFDIRQYCSVGDFFSYIRLINYMRKVQPKPDDFASTNERPWSQSDVYMIPTDPDDPMLQYDIDDVMALKFEGTAQANGTDFREDHDAHSTDRSRELVMKLQEADSRARKAEEQLQNVLQDLEKMRLVAQQFMLSSGTVSSAVGGATGDKPGTSPCTETAIKNLTREEDAAYFQPYGHYSIHQEMLQDKVRTSSYGDFILSNESVFRDKVVLDVGCGTGILSLFAAKAGAKKVFAVDQSDIYAQALDIVRENGYDDVITVIHGKLEEIQLPVEKVDIIISEWMGYFLLFESMLDTIIYARDRWLADDGVCYPDKLTIRLEASGDPDLYRDNVEYWTDVYGFRMTCMRQLVVREAAVDDVKADRVITDSAVVKEIDTNTIRVSDVDFTSEFTLNVHTDGEITAIVGYFDTFFSKNAEKQVSFSTSPSSPSTHWKQTIFLLPKPLKVHKSDRVSGRIRCKKNPQDPRSLKVTLTLNGAKMKYVVE